MVISLGGTIFNGDPLGSNQKHCIIFSSTALMHDIFGTSWNLILWAEKISQCPKLLEAFASEFRMPFIKVLLIGKLYFLDCQRSNKLPNIAGFKVKLHIRYQIEKYVCTKKTINWHIFSGNAKDNSEALAYLFACVYI